MKYLLVLALGLGGICASALAQEDEAFSDETEDFRPEDADLIEDDYTPTAAGAFGNLRIGPTVAAGFPHPLNFSVDAKYDNLIGFAVSFGSIETKAVDPLTATIENVDVRVRWFPFLYDFFAGIAVGQQTVSGASEKGITFDSGGVQRNVNAEIKLDASSTYLLPHVGWLSTWDNGLTLGAELGFMIPVTSEIEYDENYAGLSGTEASDLAASNAYDNFNRDVRNAGKLFKEGVLPYLTLLRVGWLF